MTDAPRTLPATPVARRVPAHFCPARFVRLLRVELAERWRTHAGFLLVMAVVLALLAALMLGSRSYWGLTVSDQGGWYAFGLWASGYAFAHLWLAPWQRTAPSLLALMRPAAVAEKWALTALALLLLYPLAYTAVFAAIYSVAAPLAYEGRMAQYAEAARQAAADGTLDQLTPPRRADYVAYIPFLSEGRADGEAPARGRWLSWLFYAGLTGYAATLALAFRRAAGIKALALGIALVMGTGLLLATVGDRGMEGLVRWFDRSSLWADGSALGVLRLAFWLGVPALLWVCSYFALRERDLA